MKVNYSIEIQTVPEKVFYWLEDPDRAMQWMTAVTSYEIIKETPNRVGTTYCEYVEEDGRGIEMHGVITEFVSNNRFAVHLESMVNSVDVSFALEERGSKTQLTQYVELHLKGVLKMLSLFHRTSIKKKIMKQVQEEFARLKELCEQDQNS